MGSGYLEMRSQGGRWMNTINQPNTMNGSPLIIMRGKWSYYWDNRLGCVIKCKRFMWDGVEKYVGMKAPEGFKL